VVILSDYGKGGLAHITEMIRLARAAGKPVLVDPKGEDYARYAGATLLTPNRAELRQVVGRWKDEAELRAEGQSAARRTEAGGPAGDPQRGGHDLFSAGRRCMSRPRRARFMMSAAPAIRSSRRWR
jgi:bifunctional ADP-heptose synthase (sugar kinase/adenylyltransferase)